jgi:hypothetical protein
MARSFYDWRIERGASISQEQIESELGYRREEDPQRYFSDLMKLRRECENILKARGEPSTIRTCDNGIQILGSAAALEHQTRRGRSGRAKMIDAFQQLQDTVDIGDLSPDGRRAYEDAIRVEGQYVHAIQRVRRQLRTAGHLTNEVPRDRGVAPERRRM